MDNITHSLIGLAIAETISNPKEKPKSKSALYLASAIANNIPDIDVFFTKFISPGKLGYLIHHRGHTHTLLATPLMGTLLLILFYFLWKKEILPWKKLIGVTYFGCIFHIVSDSWNIYGVHPFWPFNNQWFYGDMVFIVEPLIWILTIPYLFFSVTSTRVKTLLTIPLIGIFILAIFHQAVPKEIPLFMFIILGIIGVSYLAIKNTLIRKSTWVFSFSLLLFSFYFISQSVKAQFNHQVAATPLPANPFCWQVFQAQKDNDLYQIDVWQVSLLPKIIPVDRCGNLASSSTSAIPEVNLKPESESKLHFGRYTGSISEYKNILQTCQGKEFMKFARIPFWTFSGNTQTIGDIRFDRDSTVGFAEILIDDVHEPCPKISAPWQSISILNKEYE
ncbi:MAG: metal-dependent hydrolase [Oligoflexia bacterium]|nr:metal-dependent hydrolase [Oligoflexia bacterium]